MRDRSAEKLGPALDIVAVDPRYFRPTEVDVLIGDASKAEKILGWKPKVKFAELAKLMVNEDLKDLKQKLEGRKPEHLKQLSQF